MNKKIYILLSLALAAILTLAILPQLNNSIDTIASDTKTEIFAASQVLADPEVLTFKQTTLQPDLNPGSIAKIFFSPKGAPSNNCFKFLETLFFSQFQKRSKYYSSQKYNGRF